MKKVYKTPTMENLGDVMRMTKGTEGFAFQDFLRIMRGELDPSELDCLLQVAQNPAS